MAKGIVLTPQVTCPIPSGESGLWVNNSNQLVHRKEDENDTNVSDSIEQGIQSPYNYCLMTNNAGSAFGLGKPVSSNSFGEMQVVDISTVGAESIVGLAGETINHLSTGKIITHGRLENVSGFNFGDVLYVDPNGDLTSTRPSLIEPGYFAGDRIIRIGVVVKNSTNPLLKDLIVNIQVVAIL